LSNSKKKWCGLPFWNTVDKEKLDQYINTASDKGTYFGIKNLVKEEVL
jgi:hypothetical protein